MSTFRAEKKKEHGGVQAAETMLGMANGSFAGDNKILVRGHSITTWTRF